MKKILSLILALVATTTLWAYDFQSGDLYYNITSDTTVEVTYDIPRSGDNGNRYLKEAIIPEYVCYQGRTYCVSGIGESAFNWCEVMSYVKIPETITSIGHYAFNSCHSLTSITIGNSVTSIGDNAFSICTSLTSITIGNSVTSIGNSAFSSCSSLTTVTIGNSVTSIGDKAFSWCESLTSITIPNSVTSIGEEAFIYCSSLISVTIGNNVTSIGSSAFYDCSSLTSITIPNSVTSIGSCAFSGCFSLTTVICKAIGVPELGLGVFEYMNLSESTLYVPAQSLENYKAAEQWKEFGTILPLDKAPSAVENTRLPITNSTKFLRNGQVYILQDGKTYTVMGAEVK